MGGNLDYCCDLSHFFGSIVNVEEEGEVNMRHSYERNQLRLKVLGFGEVVGHKPNLQYL